MLDFLGNVTDSFESKALAPHADGSNIYFYRPTEKLKITGGKTHAWFGSDGGAEQFVKYMPDGNKYSIHDLLDKDLLEDITDLVKRGDIKID